MNIEKLTGKAAPVSSTSDDSETKQLVEALRGDKLMKILAEPTLMTVSGKAASLCSGAELSVPKRQPDGSMTIERQYSTEVTAAPEVLGDRVRLALRCRFSELDQSQSIRVGDQNVPGVMSRMFDTSSMELRSGQTVVIGGLVQKRVETVARGVPYLSEIPYVGAMLRKVEEERNDVMTLAIVQVEIVPAKGSSPVATGQQGNVPAPQIVRPASGPGYAPPTVSRQPAGDIRR